MEDIPTSLVGQRSDATFNIVHRLELPPTDFSESTGRTAPVTDELPLTTDDTPRVKLSPRGQEVLGRLLEETARRDEVNRRFDSNNGGMSTNRLGMSRFYTSYGLSPGLLAKRTRPKRG